MPRAAPFLAIARLTAIEAIRRPVFLLVALSGIGGILLLPLVIHYTLGDAARIIRDSALAFYLLGGFLLAATAGTETLARELRTGTAATILSKPVPRPLFLLAKAAGIAAAIALFTVAALPATLLAVRTGTSELQLDAPPILFGLLAFCASPAIAGAWNRRTRRPFTSAAFLLLVAFLPLALAAACFFPTPLDHLTFPHNFTWNILGVGALLYLCLLMTAAAAAAAATRLDTQPALLLVTAIFLGGLVSDSLLAPRLDTAPLAHIPYAILPNVQAFWLTDALDSATAIPPLYYATAALYALAWSAAALAIGAISFRLREIHR